MMAQSRAGKQQACDNHRQSGRGHIAYGQKKRHQRGDAAKSGDCALEPGHARSPIRLSVTWLTKPTTPTSMAAMHAAEISADQIWMVCP